MVVAAPAISSTVSPRTRIAIKSPPICDGVASPDIMRSKASADSSRDNRAPAATLAMSPLNSSLTTVSSIHLLAAARGIPLRGEIKKVLQHEMAVLGGDAFGMKLH